MTALIAPPLPVTSSSPTLPSPPRRDQQADVDSGAEAGSMVPRLAVAAKFASLVYLFVLAFLLLAVIVTLIISGWQPLAVVSGSMEPAVRVGSMVMVEPAEADVYFANPSIIAYDDPASPGSLVTHRVVSTASDDVGAVFYRTKGDANRVADSTPVAHDSLVGVARMIIPFLGLPAMWLASGQLVMLGAFVALTLLALVGLTVRLQQ